MSWDTQGHSRLRHCSTSRKDRGSTPDGVTGIFHPHNPSGHTMALGSTQPLTETGTRKISWGVNVAGSSGWQPYHLHVPTVSKYTNLNLLEPSGAITGLFRECFLLLILALQPTMHFSLLSDSLPFCSFFTLLSPRPYSHYLHIFFDICNLSLQLSPSNSCTYRFLL